MRIGEHRIGICDDAWKDLQKIEVALSEAVEILGEQKISLHLYTDPHKMREEDHKKKFDLVFLDLEMPEVHGFELAKWLDMQNPEVKLVFVSHYENMVFDTYDHKESVLTKNPRFETTKAEKQKHGFGMESIENIVKQYHGDYECREEKIGQELFLVQNLRLKVLKLQID